jgi:hypothetical protein
VRKYLENRFKAESELTIEEEDEVLKKVSEELQRKLLIEQNTYYLKKWKFLGNNFSEKFIEQLSLYLVQRGALKNEIIFTENQIY